MESCQYYYKNECPRKGLQCTNKITSRDSKGRYCSVHYRSKQAMEFTEEDDKPLVEKCVPEATKEEEKEDDTPREIPDEKKSETDGEEEDGNGSMELEYVRLQLSEIYLNVKGTREIRNAIAKLIRDIGEM